MLKGAPSDPDQGIVEVAALPLARAVPVLSPRALEDMFWSGRYAERAEDLLRLVITAGAYAEQLDYSSSVEGGASLRALIGALQRLVRNAVARHRSRTAVAAARCRPAGLGGALARSACATRSRACATSCRSTRGGRSAAPIGR